MLDFLGIGAQKAATTWIFEHLGRHPEIAFPAGKEMHFWNRRAGRPTSAWLEPFARLPNGVRGGEITPAYACLDTETISQVRRCAPGIRIFYSLRNPIERAWSAALMEAKRAGLDPQRAPDAWFLEQIHSPGSIARGDYHRCLTRWHSVFEPDRIEVVFFEDVVANPRNVLQRLASHIGVSPAFYSDEDAGPLHAPVFRGPVLPLRVSLLPALSEIYEHRIDVLGELLGLSFEHWKHGIASEGSRAP